MKTGKLTVFGKDYITCFSNAVVRDLEERNGKQANDELAEILEGGKVSDLVWLLHALVRGGDKYCKLMGIDNPEMPSIEDFYDGLDLADLNTMVMDAVKTIRAGQKTDVETEESSKNA